MLNNPSLAVSALFAVFALAPPQHTQSANKCPRTYGELYSAAEEILFAVPDNEVGSTATLSFEPAWKHPESQIIIQFPDNGSPIVTSFSLAPGQKSISSSVNAAMKTGTCDAASIARRVKIIRKNVPMNERLKPLIDRLWLLNIVPQQVHSIHLDATVYVLEVNGQDKIRVVTDDYESPIVRWMEEIRAAVSD
jgi:hypothetical protein